MCGSQSEPNTSKARERRKIESDEKTSRASFPKKYPWKYPLCVRDESSRRKRPLEIGSGVRAGSLCRHFAMTGRRQATQRVPSADVTGRAHGERRMAVQSVKRQRAAQRSKAVDAWDFEKPLSCRVGVLGAGRIRAPFAMSASCAVFSARFS